MFSDLKIVEEECKSACASKSGLILSFSRLSPTSSFRLRLYFRLVSSSSNWFPPFSPDCCATTALFTSANILLNFLPSSCRCILFPALFPPLKYLLPLSYAPDLSIEFHMPRIPLFHCLLLIGERVLQRVCPVFYDEYHFSPFLWTHQRTSNSPLVVRCRS